MGDLKKWAMKEIELAKKSGCDEYMNGVFNSALKSVIALYEDGHTGLSASITRTVVDRLITMKPLTELTGDDDEWTETHRNEYVSYQNNRCSSVFKKVHPDGSITYSDVDRIRCIDVNTNCSFYSGSVADVVDRVLPPITMPYLPRTSPIKVYTEDFLYERGNGDFDTRGIFYLVDGAETKMFIDVFQKETPDGWVDISKDEYVLRKQNAVYTVDDINDVSE